MLGKMTMKKPILALLPLILPCGHASAVSDGYMWFGSALYLCVAQYPAYADLPAIRADAGSVSMLGEMGRLRMILQQCQRDRATPLPLLPVALCDATMAQLPAEKTDRDVADDFGTLIQQRYQPAIQQWLDCIPR